MRPSTSSVQFGAGPVEQACERITGAGFEAIDIWDWFYNCKHLAEIDCQGYVNPFMHREPEPDAMSAALVKSREYMMACHQQAIAE